MLLRRAIHTCFRYGFSAERINLATHGNSPVHYAKGTPSHIADPPFVIRHFVIPLPLFLIRRPADRQRLLPRLLNRRLTTTNNESTNNQRKTGHSAPIACRCTVSGTISLSSRLCFSPFPHGTCPLSVAKEYLALGGGPPEFRPGSTCPAVLGKSVQEGFLTHTGLSPSMEWLSNHFCFVSLYKTCAPPQRG